MIIHAINLRDISTFPSTGAHAAVVTITTDTGNLILHASALPAPSGTPTPEADDFISRALAEDAIRQLRRMPELRSGKTPITIPDHAWPGASSNPAPVFS